MFMAKFSCNLDKTVIFREAIQKNLFLFGFLEGGGVMSKTKLFEELLCLDIFQKEGGGGRAQRQFEKNSHIIFFF